MENRNPHLELGTLPPNSQLIRRNPPQPALYNELPQDEEDHQELQAPQQNPPLLPQNPLQRPNNSTLGARFKAWLTVFFGRDLDRAMRRAIFFMLFFYVLDLILLCPITYDFYAKVRSKEQIRGALMFMSANLKANPIMDLQIIGKKSTCPDGYEPLELSAWPGTAAGCLCESGYLSYWACKDIEREGCQKDIPHTNPIEIEEWDGVIWCGKRAVLGQDYLKKAQCPMGYEECYNGGCFQGECPITKVEMDSNGALKFTKTQGELPLINIQTSSNDIPCFNKDFSAKSNSSYKFLDGEELANKGCDKYGFDDKYSTKLYSHSLFDSYTQDSYKNSTVNLPYYEKYSKETTSVLSWRVRMKTEKNDYCLDLDQNMAKTSTKAFHNAFMPDIIIELILACHLIILLPLCICRCCLSKAQFLVYFESAFMVVFFSVLPASLLQLSPFFVNRADAYPELTLSLQLVPQLEHLFPNIGQAANFKFLENRGVPSL